VVLDKISSVDTSLSVSNKLKTLNQKMNCQQQQQQQHVMLHLGLNLLDSSVLLQQEMWSSFGFIHRFFSGY